MLDKRQAAELLGISERTLRRRMQDGTYRFTRVGSGQFAQVYFSYSDLGLTAPESEPKPTPATRAVEAAPEPEPEPQQEPKTPKEPVVIFQGIAMSEGDARTQRLRQRNRRYVADWRSHLLQNSGPMYHYGNAAQRKQIENEIDAQCDQLLKQMNRGIR